MLNLWPSRSEFMIENMRLIKDGLLIASLMPCMLSVLGDLVMHFYEENYNLQELMDNLIAFNCIIGMIYMTCCFILKRRLIMKLVASIDNFKKYGGYSGSIETDKKANMYAKLFISYGIAGNIVYMLMPYLNKKECNEKKENLTIFDDGVPCGLVVRCRFPFRIDYSPVFEIVFIHQIYTCTMVTFVILVLTLLLCGFLMHITYFLRHLRSYVRQLMSNDYITPIDLHNCVKYHIAIITFSKNVNKAFNNMMMLHLTLTSVVISCLGFQILISDSLNDSIRFSGHLIGWLVLLLLICYYGQHLIDESLALAEDFYFVPWFKVKPATRKDISMIIMRSQRPLTLTAANIRFISLPTYLGIISSAYSYFTLLWKIKS